MTANEVNNVTIIGAGQAGFQVAQSLRKRSYGGEITLLGDEGLPAYQRPPLSKAFLKGQLDESRLYFRQENFYSDSDIRLQKSSRVDSIDVAEKLVTCIDGQTFRYDRLVIATGARPIAIPVPGAELDGVYALRSVADSIAIRKRLTADAQIVVIGGGYIGLEVASAVNQLGYQVTVVERLPSLMSRVTSPAVSRFYLDLHRSKGVDVRLESAVAEILGDQRVNGVKLASGEEIPADIIVVGVGVRPNHEVAEAAGIDCDDGVLIDVHCHTSVPDVYAAGDCARRIVNDGDTLRLESVHNALDQAERIAADIVGDPELPYDPPWFWSDQYDVKLQTVGLFNDYTDIGIRGNVDDGRFATLYFKEDTLIAIDAVNDPVSFMAGKQLLKKRLSVSKANAMGASMLKDLIGDNKNRRSSN